MYSLIAVCLLALSGASNALPIATSQQLQARGAYEDHNGMATFYDTQQNNGACGWYNRNDEHVIAISQSLWDETSNGQGGSTLCGRSATLSRYGRSTRVTVVDLCPECGYNDLDLSPAAFNDLASQEEGRLYDVQWKFD